MIGGHLDGAAGTASRADALIDGIDRILTATTGQSGLAPTPRTMLAKAVESLGAFRQKMAELQSYVLLIDPQGSGHDMDAARGLWDSMGGDPDRDQLRQLTDASPTLSALDRAAVTIEGMQRFSPEQLTLAARIGELLALHPHYVGSIANAKFAEFGVTRTAGAAVGKLLDELARIGAIDGFTMEGLIEPKEGRPFWRRREKITGGTVARWRVKRGTVSPEYAPFLSGHWLTAYAYGIAEDQFRRAREPFEIYSNVRYRIPGDLGGGQSDIDVLVRTADVLLCIECKSGKLLTARTGRNAAQKTAHNAARLDALLDTMNVELERHYELLYLPSSDESSDEIATAVRGAVRLDLMTPADVRTLVMRVAKHQAEATPAAVDQPGRPEPAWPGRWIKAVEGGGVFDLVIEHDGTVTERSLFDEGDPRSGTWNADGDRLEIRIGDGTMAFDAKADGVLVDEARGAWGDGRRTMMVRCEVG